MKNKWIVICGLILGSWSCAVVEADVIPGDRLVDWSQTGVVQPDGTKGIPHRTAICHTVVSTETTADIQTDIDNCADDHVLQFPAGTWTITNRLLIDHPVIIRGSGASRTKLVSSDAITFSPVRGGEPYPTYAVDWTAGYNKGDTVLTLASLGNLAVGQTVVVDQLNDPSLVNIEGNEGSQGLSRNGLSFDGGQNRAQPEIVQIKAIDTLRHTITIDPPLYYTHQPSLAPQVFWWNGGNINYAGIEDLKVDAAGNGYRAIEFHLCTNSWAKGVEVVNSGRCAIGFVFYCLRPEIRDCYLHDCQLPYGPTRYGIELGDVSAGLAENNIIDHVVGGLITSESTSGSVTGYNFFTRCTFQNGVDTAWVFGSFETHICHTYANLFEGNFGTLASLDNVWGSGSHNTLFRNRLLGYEGAIPGIYINDTNTINIAAWNRYVSVVGNILGAAGWHTFYQADPWSWDGTKDWRYFIYILAEWHDLDDTARADAQTLSTLLRWGNFDYATNQTHWDAGEIPSGVPVPTDHTLPISYYLAARPSWWNTSPWPAIGPDVSGLVKNIPAQDCYINSNLANGGAFDPILCYGDTSTPPASGVPVILGQPQNKSVFVGQTANFTVIAFGNPSPQFQWKKNGAAITGATGASYTTPSALLSDSGSVYSCDVTNASGTVTTSGATLTVTAAPTAIAFLAFKNIFNPTKETLTIKLSAGTSDADLKIYDRSGNKVRSLEVSSANVIWDGRNDSGSIVASGSYIAILKWNGNISKKKLVVVK